ncbi:MAG: DNA-deoxyinosine glycosylase [Rhodocyclaceae bacterium]
MANNRLQGLPPILDERARVLILGSFPSEASLAAGQYYAHPRNQFWKILGEILGQPLPEMDYAAKQAAVKAAGLAIWDVYASCERVGSLDAAIRNGTPNDFAQLKESAKRPPAAKGDLPETGAQRLRVAPRRHEAPARLQRVCFNGRTAGRFAPQIAALGFETLILPSTSPANASWSYAEKLAAWRAALAV